MKIYALFVIYNQHDQPNNNLLSFWTKIPCLQQIAESIGILINKETESYLFEIRKCKEVGIDSNLYRLQIVSEGEILSND